MQKINSRVCGDSMFYPLLIIFINVLEKELAMR